MSAMKITSLGHDLDLGRKFFEESNGLVMTRVKAAPRRPAIATQWLDRQLGRPSRPLKYLKSKFAGFQPHPII